MRVGLNSMSQETIDFGTNNSICQAAGCLAKAKMKIFLNVGRYGIVSILVCESCLPKFQGVQ